MRRRCEVGQALYRAYRCQYHGDRIVCCRWPRHLYARADDPGRGHGGGQVATGRGPRPRRGGFDAAAKHERAGSVNAPSQPV